MEVKAVSKFVRLSWLKGQDLAREIQGLPVEEALRITKFSNRKAGRMIGKTLRSAIANAEANNDLSPEDLYVKEAVVDKGPMFGRYWPRARGMVSPIRRRMSHISIVLTDQKVRKKK